MTSGAVMRSRSSICRAPETVKPVAARCPSAIGLSGPVTRTGRPACAGAGRPALRDQAGVRTRWNENPGLAEQGDPGWRPTEIGPELLRPGVELRGPDAEAEIFDESDIGRQEPVDENRVIGTELD